MSEQNDSTELVATTPGINLPEWVEGSAELAIAGAAAEKQYEIQSAILIAKKFPRNEDGCFQALMRAAMRPAFAEDAAYSFPRGGQEVTGPSVHLAREGARIWGNIRHGLAIVRDDDETRQIKGWAWDMQTNTMVTAEDNFRKLIERKGKGWIRPDERDLRELTNRRGAILVRNCILQLLPKDLIEDALQMCTQTLEQKAKDDPDFSRKKLIVSFARIHVTIPMMEKKLGHPFAEATPPELAELQAIYKSIADGNSTWAEYTGTEEGEPPRLSQEAKAASVREKIAKNTGKGIPTEPATLADTAWLELCTEWDENHHDIYVAVKSALHVKKARDLKDQERQRFYTMMQAQMIRL